MSGGLERSDLLGAVLAGGLGTRFGSPKGRARLHGVPLALRAAETLAQVVGPVVIVSSLPLPESHVPVVPDFLPGTGPLGAIVTALREADARGAPGVLVLACDLPLVTPAFLGLLLTAAGDAMAAAPVAADGRLEPLCALYRCEMLPLALERLAEGRLAVYEWFRAGGGCAVPLEALHPDAADCLLNVNTVSDLERVQAVLDTRGGGPREGA